VTLAADMATDAASILITDEIGETVTYTPSGGSPKAIVAEIDRDNLGPDAQLRGVATQGVRIKILRDATLGIATPQDGKDLVSIPKHRGSGTNVTYRLERTLTNSTPGIWHLSLTK